MAHQTCRLRETHGNKGSVGTCFIPQALSGECRNQTNGSSSTNAGCPQPFHRCGMIGSRVCGEYGDSPPIQPRFTASTANRINSLVKQHPVRKFRSAAPMLGSALPCLAMPGPASLSQPPLHSPVFRNCFWLPSSRGLGPSMGKSGGLSPGVPFRSRNPHRSLCDKAAPPFSCRLTRMLARRRRIRPLGPWCYCRFRGARVLGNRVQVAWC